MINKKFTLLLLALAVFSCSSNKKNTENNSAPQLQKITQEEKPLEAKKAEEIKEVISLVVEEDEGLESEPQVIYFATNSSKLVKDSVSTLSQKVLPQALSAKTKKVVVEAHADERGSAIYNQKLSERRAKAVKDYLIKNGVRSAKVRTVGYGETKPVALGHDEAAWSQNRRAVMISIKK
jgi:peptidoglycan-associated lipoprotein